MILALAAVNSDESRVGRGIVAGIFERFIGAHHEQTVLRIHERGFSHTHIEERGIKQLDARAGKATSHAYDCNASERVIHCCSFSFPTISPGARAPLFAAWRDYVTLETPLPERAVIPAPALIGWRRGCTSAIPRTSHLVLLPPEIRNASVGR